MNKNTVVNYIRNHKKELLISASTIGVVIAGVCLSIGVSRNQSDDNCFVNNQPESEYVYPKHSEHGWYLPSDD